MNEKTNLQDLANLIAERSGITIKDVEYFLREFIETIQEALLNDESVRIKNLGTFKRLTVSARESVDVSTGKRVVIPAHYKVNFDPDNNLAQAVNEPFSLFDTIELEDTADTTGLFDTPPRLNETSRLSGTPRLNDTIRPNETQYRPSETQYRTGETQYRPSETQYRTGETQYRPSETQYRTGERQYRTGERPITIIEEPPKTNNNSDKTPYSSSQKRSHTKKRKNSRWLSSLIFVLLVLIGLGVLIYMFVLDKADVPTNPAYTSRNAIPKTHKPAIVDHKTADTEKDTVTMDDIIAEDPVIIEESSVAENTTVQTPIEIVEKKTPENLPEKTVTVETTTPAKKYTLKTGDRLMAIALQEYGDKAFWVYLYEENKEKIKNPDNIPAGLTITIPAASKYGINKDDPASVQKAQALQPAILQLRTPQQQNWQQQDWQQQNWQQQNWQQQSRQPQSKQPQSKQPQNQQHPDFDWQRFYDGFPH